MLHDVPGARAADIRLGLRDGLYGSPDCRVHTLNFVPTALPVGAGQEDDTGGHGYDTDSDPEDDTNSPIVIIRSHTYFGEELNLLARISSN